MRKMWTCRWRDLLCRKSKWGKEKGDQNLQDSLKGDLWPFRLSCVLSGGCRGECADQLPLSFASTAAPSLVDMHSAQSNSQKQSAQVALICAIYSSSMFWAMSAAYASLWELHAPTIWGDSSACLELYHEKNVDLQVAGSTLQKVQVRQGERLTSMVPWKWHTALRVSPMTTSSGRDSTLWSCWAVILAQSTLCTTGIRSQTSGRCNRVAGNVQLLDQFLYMLFRSSLSWCYLILWQICGRVQQDSWQDDFWKKKLSIDLVRIFSLLPWLCVTQQFIWSLIRSCPVRASIAQVAFFTSHGLWSSADLRTDVELATDLDGARFLDVLKASQKRPPFNYKALVFVWAVDWKTPNIYLYTPYIDHMVVYILYISIYIYIHDIYY